VSTLRDFRSGGSLKSSSTEREKGWLLRALFRSQMNLGTTNGVRQAPGRLRQVRDLKRLLVRYETLDIRMRLYEECLAWIDREWDRYVHGRRNPARQVASRCGRACRPRSGPPASIAWRGACPAHRVHRAGHWETLVIRPAPFAIVGSLDGSARVASDHAAKHGKFEPAILRSPMSDHWLGRQHKRGRLLANQRLPPLRKTSTRIRTNERYIPVLFPTLSSRGRLIASRSCE
jgi:hypothetical protein